MSNYDDVINNASTKVQSGQLSKEDYAAKKKRNATIYSSYLT